MTAPFSLSIQSMDMRGAVISTDGMYRYRLYRQWEIGAKRACFIMLNPSTANETEDDPTIRRCIGFAKAWGYGGLTVVNLFAFRATDPDALNDAVLPYGPENSVHIVDAVRDAGIVVAAWGAHRKALLGQRHVEGLVAKHADLHALAFTKDGHPKHPLYLPAGLKPQLWRPKGWRAVEEAP